MFTVSSSHCQCPHEVKFSICIIFVPQIHNNSLFSLTPTDKNIISLLSINGTLKKKLLTFYTVVHWKVQLSWVILELLLPKSSHISWQWHQSPKIQPFLDTGVVLWPQSCVLWLPFWESYIWNSTFIYKSPLGKGKFGF